MACLLHLLLSCRTGAAAWRGSFGLWSQSNSSSHRAWQLQRTACQASNGLHPALLASDSRAQLCAHTSRRKIISISASLWANVPPMLSGRLCPVGFGADAQQAGDCCSALPRRHGSLEQSKLFSRRVTNRFVGVLRPLLFSFLAPWPSGLSHMEQRSVAAVSHRLVHPKQQMASLQRYGVLRASTVFTSCCVVCRPTIMDAAHNATTLPAALKVSEFPRE